MEDPGSVSLNRALASKWSRWPRHKEQANPYENETQQDPHLLIFQKIKNSRSVDEISSPYTPTEKSRPYKKDFKRLPKMRTRVLNLGLLAPDPLYHISVAGLWRVVSTGTHAFTNAGILSKTPP
jgi:hypothetical protein